MITKRRNAGLALVLALALGTSGCAAAEKFLKSKEGAATVGGLVGAGGAKALGGDTSEALAAAALGGLVGFMIADASESEQQAAEAEAMRARQSMQQAEIEQLRKENRVYMMKVAPGTYVPVDPVTGKAVGDKKVHLDEDPLESNPNDVETVATSDGGNLRALKRDNVEVGEDRFNVIFVELQEPGALAQGTW